jgi:hypothetical protein
MRTGTAGPRASVQVRQRLFAALVWLAAGCSPGAGELEILAPALGPGSATLRLAIASTLEAGSLEVTLGGAPITGQFTRTLMGAFATVPVTPGETLALVARARFSRGSTSQEVRRERTFVVPPPFPDLVTTRPAAGAAEVVRSEWLRLEFASRPDPAALTTFDLACGGSVEAGPRAFTSALAPDGIVVVNPVGELPGGAQCVLSWLGSAGPEFLPFSTAAPGAPAHVVYDRSEASRTAPIPDDLFVVEDLATATGARLAVPLPDLPDQERGVFEALLEDANQLDGWSPIAHLVIELSDPPDPSSLPRTPAESLDPTASLALLDLDRLSPDFAERIPFRVDVRTDTTVSGAVGHNLLVFPSVPLRARGRYGFVVTRRAFADPGRPFDPSPAFAQALGPAESGEADAIARARALADDVLAVAESALVPPIPRDDVALALRISIRSIDALPRDLLSVREQAAAAPLPAFTIDSVVPDPGGDADVAAIVTGTWTAPDWRVGANFARDAQGLPEQTGTHAIPFTLALPAAALSGPVPLTFYQHGNPGSAENEVPRQVRSYLGEAGFAVIGFTDVLNREVSRGIQDEVAAITQQVVDIVVNLLLNRKIPDYWLQTNAEQLAFLRLVAALGALDVLPIGAPDGVPELDLGAPLTYVGISQGANHGPGFLPYAPEVRAAALMVGGARLAEVLIHQQADAFVSQLGLLFPELSAADIWSGVSLFQAIFDVQDAHNHAHFLYREPVAVGGSLDKPSLLVVEGLGDSLVPNHATESLAFALGPIPHLEPVQRAVPFLAPVRGPVAANVDARTSAAFYQYVPVGTPGIAPTPGCTVLSGRSATEGHYCAQGAEESRRQRVQFFQSAVRGDPAPVIVDPQNP